MISRPSPIILLATGYENMPLLPVTQGRATVAALRLSLVISITFVGMQFTPSSHPLFSILKPRSVTIQFEEELWHGTGQVDPRLAMLTQTESGPVVRWRTASARAGCPFLWWSEPVVPARR
jgi:hypothetical protein